jgi:hypothetical protein
MTESLKKEGITICTVSFGHKRLIEMNVELTKKMNPNQVVHWVIVENTPDEKGDTFSVGEKEDILVVKGIKNNFKGIGSASYHHAFGLNSAIKEVKTKYALILDPDFFIIKKNWVNEIIEFMSDEGLAFWGVPYNPKRYMKYRYFPCIHCMFIDLSLVGKEEVDFNPDYNQPVFTPGNVVGKEKNEEVRRTFLASLIRHLRIMIKRSSIVCSSRDTGYKIFEKFYTKKKLKCGYASPVFKMGVSATKPFWVGSILSVILEKFLPERLCYLPKRNGYYSSTGFGELGYSDVFREGWDEFIWKGKPFGFHMQGANKDGTTKDHSGEMERLSGVFDTFLDEGKVKNIFFAMFEGVESKNILRTGIVEKVLEGDLKNRAILFMKNKERAEYYAKQFPNPRIIYEVVEPDSLGTTDRIFSSLKFKFLQTETTDLRAKMMEEDKGVIYYYYSILIHRILARPFFVLLFRWFDFKIVKNNSFDTFFEKYKPSLVFLANLFEDHEVNLLRAAKKNNVFSIGLINSWDRVTARCILRLLPNKLIVFNDAVKEEVVETNYVKPTDIFVSGLPQYDYYFLPVESRRGDFLEKVGLGEDDKVIFYSPIGGMFSNSDWEMIDLLHRLNNEGKFGENVKIFVSFPPNDFIKEEELKKRPWLLYQYIGVRFSKVRSTDWDITSRDLENLKNLLFHTSVVICYASSLSVDAAVFDKPVININFEVKENGSLSKSPTVFYQMTHYKKALAVGGIRLVNNENELIEWVRKYLENPSLDRDGRRRLVERQCKYVDGKSVDRITSYINSFLNKQVI